MFNNCATEKFSLFTHKQMWTANTWFHNAMPCLYRWQHSANTGSVKVNDSHTLTTLPCGYDAQYGMSHTSKEFRSMIQVYFNFVFLCIIV